MALAWSESPATTLARHAYFAPVLLAALRFGLLGGVHAGLASVFLAAPFVLPDVELAGVALDVADALLVYPMLVLGGWPLAHCEKSTTEMAATGDTPVGVLVEVDGGSAGVVSFDTVGEGS